MEARLARNRASARRMQIANARRRQQLLDNGILPPPGGVMEEIVLARIQECPGLRG